MNPARPVGVVLAAGAGQRLWPLTRTCPKALCPVDNVPLVDRALDRVEPYVDAVAVNVHHGRDQLVEHLTARPAGRVPHLAVEPVALGTAGALGALRDWIDCRSVLVHNADAYLTEPLDRLLDGWGGARCRLLVVRAGRSADFGTLRYVGAALLPWTVVAGLPDRPAGLYETAWRAAERAGDLEFVETSGTAIDCGTPADYLRANLHASGGRSVIGPGAVVAGELVRSVVWPGGVVRAGERLVDSIRVGTDLTVSAGQVGRPDPTTALPSRRRATRAAPPAGGPPRGPGRRAGTAGGG